MMRRLSEEDARELLETIGSLRGGLEDLELQILERAGMDERAPIVDKNSIPPFHKEDRPRRISLIHPAPDR